MIKSFKLALFCLFLSVTGMSNAMNLQGRTLRISDGDVSLFEGREIHNGSLIISEGNYILRINKEKGACIIVGDNMELVIDGTLHLVPNDYKSCDVIRVTGRNVKIHGKGSIIGDRYKHTGRDGEWGMGIRLKGSSNVAICGLTIADCWGDCIYIGGGSKNTMISDCLLRGSRRQGISITRADGVTISNCRIANISGTNPQYAIDIEPNEGCTVDNVLIKNVTVTGCEGGFRAIAWKKEKRNVRIGRVEIQNCNVMARSRHTIQFVGCEQAIVKDCVMKTRKGENPINTIKVGHLLEDNNKVIYN